MLGKRPFSLGFTNIQLLVVITIISVLVAPVAPPCETAAKSQCRPAVAPSFAPPTTPWDCPSAYFDDNANNQLTCKLKLVSGNSIPVFW
jgi:hypothetical protein